VVNFIYNTSLLAMQSPLPANTGIIEIDGLRMMDLSSALIHCSPTMFEKNPIDMRAVLAQITDASEILQQLLDGSHTVIAGRLAGAFRNLGQDRIADDIVKTMRAADFDIRENDPFQNRLATELSFREKSPYANRIRLLWQNFREVIVQCFPISPGL